MERLVCAKGGWEEKEGSRTSTLCSGGIGKDGLGADDIAGIGEME